MFKRLFPGFSKVPAVLFSIFILMVIPILAQTLTGLSYRMLLQTPSW